MAAAENGAHFAGPPVSLKKSHSIMKNLLPRFIVTGVLLLAAITVLGKTNIEQLKSATDGIKDENDRLAVQAALAEFGRNPQLHDFFELSYGVVVFPTIGKGGLGIGGAHGSGWGFRQGRLDGSSKMTQVTIGFQAGGQAFSQIIFFENEADYNRFASGNFELGAQASAIAITAGANAQASTAGGANAGANAGAKSSSQAKRTYSDGMAIFTMAKGGLMYEAAVGGQKFSYRAFTEK
jgi:lipid-binding SYLF domain-containing protein